MKKKDKTPAENQNRHPQNQINAHKARISFDSETWTQLETSLGGVQRKYAKVMYSNPPWRQTI